MHLERVLLVALFGLIACGPIAGQQARLQLAVAPQRNTALLPPHLGDPLLRIPLEATCPLQPPLHPLDEGRSAWHSAGIGALIGLGVGSAVGLVAANNRSGGIGDPGPGYVFAVCAGSGVVLGGLIGLVVGSGSGRGGMTFPDY
jgi:hypothetical protein